MKRATSMHLSVCWMVVLSFLISAWNFSPAVAADEKSVEMAGQENVATSDDAVKKEFAYNPVGKRDPFEPLVREEVKLSEQQERERGPLEKFELGQFRLLAMLLVKGMPRAMVKAPDGKSYIVKPGDKIGKLEGEIISIETKVVDPETRAVVSPDRVVIKEVGFDPYSNKQVVEYRQLTM